MTPKEFSEEVEKRICESVARELLVNGKISIDGALVTDEGKLRLQFTVADCSCMYADIHVKKHR